MIRPQEKIIARKAAVYTLSVHIALILIMVISLEWRIKLPQVAEVELWDSIPQPSAKVIEPPLVEKEVELKPPKPVEKPSKVEEIIKSLTNDKADISLKQKKAEERKKEEEQKKKDELKKIQETLLKQDQLAQLQQELLQDKSKPNPNLNPNLNPARESDTKQVNPHPTEGGAMLGEIDKYKVLIQRKIHQYVNKQLCGVNPIEIQFEIGLMPTGELMGNPKMLKSSGIAVCDESVERAIFQSQPLPVPTDIDLFSKFKKLNLTFHPNEKI